MFENVISGLLCPCWVSHSTQIMFSKLLSNNKEEKNVFIVKKTRLHLNPVIKANITNIGTKLYQYALKANNTPLLAFLQKKGTNWILIEDS